ncbi:hypothetical protein AB3N58_10130 [Leptospira sp. WS60.C2]
MKRLSKKEILYISYVLYIIGILLLTPLTYKAFTLFAVRNWKKVYCPIVAAEATPNFLVHSSTRYNKTDFSRTTTPIYTYYYKIKLPDGKLVEFDSNKYYNDEIPVYFDELNNYKIVESNYQLINILSFILGIFLIFYTNIKSNELLDLAYE